MAAHTDLRIALFGTIGSGKSSAANIILGRDWFRVGFSSRAVTQTCERKTTVVNNKTILIIDTPGLFGPSTKAEINEMENCAKMSDPGLHVFLLVIRLDVRLPEEKNIIKQIQKYFGKDAARFTIILFTHTDHLNGEPLEDYIMDSSDLQTLIEMCGDRYISFNNMNKESRDQVNELLQMIDEMVKINEGHHPTPEVFNKVWTISEMLGFGFALGALGVAFGLGAVVGSQILKQV